MREKELLSSEPGIRHATAIPGRNVPAQPGNIISIRRNQ